MKKKWLSMILLVSLLISAWPAPAMAISTAFGDIPIYMGYVDIDYMAEQILKEIPTEGKTPTEQIRAVYDWIIKNCKRDQWDGTYYFDTEAIYQNTSALMDSMNTAYFNGQLTTRLDFHPDTLPYDPNDFFPATGYDVCNCVAGASYDMLVTRTGSCVNYSALLSLLLGHLGYDCRLISGEFINRDGSSVSHTWNYVLVGDTFYWMDVRMDHATYTRTGQINYAYFMQPNTTVWATEHAWDHTYSDWLAANAASITQQYAQSTYETVMKAHKY